MQPSNSTGLDYFKGIFIFTVALFLVYSYGQADNEHNPPIPQLNQNPKASRGTKIIGGYLKVKKVLGPHALRARVHGLSCQVDIENHKLEVGDYFSVYAEYRGFSHIKALEVERHPLRKIKRYIGYLGALLFAVWLFYLAYSRLRNSL